MKKLIQMDNSGENVFCVAGGSGGIRITLLGRKDRIISILKEAMMSSSSVGELLKSLTNEEGSEKGNRRSWTVEGTIWDFIYQVVWWSPAILIILGLISGAFSWAISGIAKVVQRTEMGYQMGRTEAERSSLRGKVQAIERIESEFKKSFGLAQECNRITEVVARTQFDVMLAGIANESAEGYQIWRNTRSKVIGELTNTCQECQRYLTYIEPLARIVRIERYLKLSLLGCEQCRGLDEGVGENRCVALEVLSGLEMVRSWTECG
jgi:hypothetical protein